MGEMVRCRHSASAGGGALAAGGQGCAALGAGSGDVVAAGGGLHAGTEAVVALALGVAGLVGALGGHGGTRDETRRKEPESLLCADLAGQAGACIESRPPAPWPPDADRQTAAMHPSGGGGSLPVPLFPRPLRARIRMRDAAPSLCRTERMDAWPRCLERLAAEFLAEDVHAWLKPLQATWRDDATVLYAPNKIGRAHV